VKRGEELTKKNVWHTDGNQPIDYPDQEQDMVRYFVLRYYPERGYDVSIEPWVCDTDFQGRGIITPAHFSAYTSGKLIGWQPLPPPVSEDAAGWRSEYRGDENPKKDGVYVCTTTCDNKRYEVKECFWNAKKGGWSQFCNGDEVLAWREFPKHFEPKAENKKR